MKKLQHFGRAFIAEDEGATMIEYGLLAALIAIVVAAVALSLGNSLANRFENVRSCVDNTGDISC